MISKNTPITIRKVNKTSAAWRRRFIAFYSDCILPKRDPALPHDYFAAYLGQEIVGHSEIYLEEGKWIMAGLRVKAGFREQGLARELTRARILYAVEQGANEAWYHSGNDNLMTVCCHVSLGFRKFCPPGHNCNALTPHWYRITVTKKLAAKLMKQAPKLNGA